MSKRHNRFSYSYDEPKEEKSSELVNDESLLVDENEVAAVQEAEAKTIEVDEEEAEEMIEKLDKVVVKTATVNALSNMRKEPNMGSDVLLVLEKGTKVNVFPNEGDFHKIEYKGKIGYIKKELCS